MEKEKLESRLENIEKILKMLLVNSVLNEDANQAILHEMTNEISIKLNPLGMKNIRINNIEGNNYVFANLEVTELKKIREVYVVSSEVIGDLKLVLVFNQLALKRKQAFEKSEISYFLEKTGELKIY